MASKFWKNSFVVMIVAICIDYYIASKLAGVNNGVWDWFAILTIVPMAFYIKVALIRIVVWKVFIKNDLVSEYAKMFSAEAWVRPNSEYQDADDYLSEVMGEQNKSVKNRIEAAKMYGYLRALYESRQVVGALQMSSALKAAMIIYEKRFREEELSGTGGVSLS